MAHQAEFEKNFHSISGITIGERRKNLNALLHETKSHQNEIDFTSITPETALEDVFKVETQIFFRKTDDLLTVLCEGNSVLIKKVLNASHWFINAAFENVNGEELVTDVFSKFSYNTKIKLLHKVAKFSPGVHKSDEYFQSVQKSYGLYLATKLLESCSENLILRIIENYRVEVKPRQLLTIVKKYPKITEKVLDLLEKQNYKKTINEKYSKFYDKYKLNLTFGKRRTKAFISQNRDYVIQNANKMHKILKFKQTYECLKSDFEEYLYNMFPKSFHQFQDNYEQYLLDLDKTSLSKPKQFNVLVKLFKKLYGNEIWDFPSLVTLELLELMSPDDREVWMESHIKPKNMTEEIWISLMKTEKSIPSLIERIALTSNEEIIGELIDSLLSTCRVNNDLNALLRVLEYVTKRHMNDDVDMRGQFLYEVSRRFDLHTLSGEHWKYLMKFTRCYLIDKNSISHYVRELYNGYIYYCYLHELDVHDLALEYLKLSTYGYDVHKKVPAYEKYFLRIIAEAIPKAFIEKENLTEHYRWYLRAVYDYNERNLKERMSYFENSNAIQHLKEELAEPVGWCTERVLRDCLKFEFKQSLEAGLVKMYFYHIEDRQDVFFNSFLKNDPENFANIVLPVLEKWCKLSYLRCLKYYDHLGIPQKFTEKHVTSENSLLDSDSLKPNEMHCLSYTMKAEDFLSLIASYSSEDLVTNCETEAELNIYETKKVAFSCMKNLTPPEAALQSLLNFFQSDYLKLTCNSLHSICNNLSENKIMNIVNILNNREVSVRKHSISLAFHLLNKRAIYVFIEKLTENETSISIRKHILKATFKLFLNTQEQRDFQLVKESVKAMDLEDSGAYPIILNNIKKVSSKYFIELILFIWELLENVQNPGKEILEGMRRILNAIDESNIGSLPEEFCTRVIENYLFKSRDSHDFESSVETFALRYMIYHNSDQVENRIKCVLSIAHSYVQANWYNIETYKTGRECISKFVLEFSKNFLSKKCKNLKIIETFLKIWENLFEPFVIYNEFLHLNFTLLYVKCVEHNSTIFEIGEQLRELCNYLQLKGLLNITIFCSVFGSLKSDFEVIEEDQDPNESFLVMAEGVLAKNISSSGFMLAMFLLPDVEKLTSKNKEKYESIFNQIVRQKDPNIQIYLHNHILDNKVTVDYYSNLEDQLIMH